MIRIRDTVLAITSEKKSEIYSRNSLSSVHRLTHGFGKTCASRWLALLPLFAATALSVGFLTPVPWASASPSPGTWREVQVSPGTSYTIRWDLTRHRGRGPLARDRARRVISIGLTATHFALGVHAVNPGIDEQRWRTP